MPKNIFCSLSVPRYANRRGEVSLGNLGAGKMTFWSFFPDSPQSRRRLLPCNPVLSLIIQWCKGRSRGWNTPRTVGVLEAV